MNAPFRPIAATSSCTDRDILTALVGEATRISETRDIASDTAADAATNGGTAANIETWGRIADDADRRLATVRDDIDAMVLRLTGWTVAALAKAIGGAS